MFSCLLYPCRRSEAGINEEQMRNVLLRLLLFLFPYAKRTLVAIIATTPSGLVPLALQWCIASLGAALPCISANCNLVLTTSFILNENEERRPQGHINNGQRPGLCPSLWSLLLLEQSADSMLSIPRYVDPFRLSGMSRPET